MNNRICSSPSDLELESLKAFLQFLTRALILSTKMESATESSEEGCVSHFLRTGLPIRSLEADSCSLDKYDMPAQRTKKKVFPD